MSYLLTSTTTEELKAVLQKGGVKILAEGGPDELARYIAGEGRPEKGSVALIWLVASGNALTEPGSDESVFSSIREDSSLVASLKEEVDRRVKEQGFFVVDMLEFGLSERLARAVAAEVGVDVTTGIKAVFVPAVAEEATHQ
jgi:hypothetical protein